MKTRFPAAAARAVADDLVGWLAPFCAPDRILVAGSLRRQRPDVGEVEILFVPLHGPIATDLFTTVQDLAAHEIELAVNTGKLAKRPNALGRDTWGAEIKLALHSASGIPVDFFTATMGNWFNYLVCRTGPAESNLAIARAAQSRGWGWHPYRSGFATEDGSKWSAPMRSERDVFEFVGLPYRKPEDR
jgi:DNA polymerase/3'-5' exonuclease PolX